MQMKKPEIHRSSNTLQTPETLSVGTSEELRLREIENK